MCGYIHVMFCAGFGWEAALIKEDKPEHLQDKNSDDVSVSHFVVMR